MGVELSLPILAITDRGARFGDQLRKIEEDQ